MRERERERGCGKDRERESEREGVTGGATPTSKFGRVERERRR